MALHVNDDPAGTQEKLVAHTLSEHKTEGLHGLNMLQHYYSVPDIKKNVLHAFMQDTFGVPSSLEQHVTYHTTGDEASRLYMKKTIVVGNVSKYEALRLSLCPFFTDQILLILIYCIRIMVVACTVHPV